MLLILFDIQNLLEIHHFRLMILNKSLFLTTKDYNSNANWQKMSLAIPGYIMLASFQKHDLRLIHKCSFNMLNGNHFCCQPVAITLRQIDG